MKPHKSPAAIAAILIASTIWGISFVLAKLALTELPVPHVLLYRFLFAIVPFVPILLQRKYWPQRRDLGRFALTGFLMVPVTFMIQVGGLTLTSASSAALFVGTGAPLLALAAVLVEHERLGRRGWSAVVLSSLGIGLLVGLPGADDDWRGNILILLSMIICTVWVIMSKRLIQRYPALHATAWILAFGTLFLIPVSLLAEGLPPVDLSAAVWGSLLGLGLGCTTLAYVLWNWGVSRVGAGAAGVYLNLEPIAGAAAAVILLGESMGAGMFLGGGAILGAAALVSTGTASPEIEERPPTGLWNWWLDNRPSVLARYVLRHRGPDSGVDGRLAPAQPKACRPR